MVYFPHHIMVRTGRPPGVRPDLRHEDQHGLDPSRRHRQNHQLRRFRRRRQQLHARLQHRGAHLELVAGRERALPLACPALVGPCFGFLFLRSPAVITAMAAVIERTRLSASRGLSKSCPDIPHGAAGRRSTDLNSRSHYRP